MIIQIIGGIVRTILAAVFGGMAAKGLMTDDEMQQIIGAVLTLIVLGWSVWQKSRRATAPGAEFNPRAEVRKPKSYKFPKTGGYAEPGMFLLLLACTTWACLSALGQVAGLSNPALTSRALQESRSALVTPESAREWLAAREVEDPRPFLMRLLLSIQPTGKMSLVGEVSELGIKGGAEF